jgi:nicotinamidase-related amidase
MTTALLLMDVQSGILARFDDSDDYLDRMVAAQVQAEQAGLPVVLVRVGFSPGHPEISARNKVFSAIKAADGMVLGQESTQPHPRLLRGKGEVVVTKKRISAFAGDYRLTVLADLCRDGDDDVHRILTEKVFPRQADVIDSADWQP